MTRRKITTNGTAPAEAMSAIDLCDLVRSVPLSQAVGLVEAYSAVVASAAALKATRDTYANVDKVLAERKTTGATP